MAITPRKRLDSHRLIEEFMICANVVAAAGPGGAEHALPLSRPRSAVDGQAGNAPGASCKGGYSLNKGTLKPVDFTRILDKARGTDEASLISEVILRSQAQAAYSPENIGHFGLALRRYAHFTSPIRRYADLIVHRGLIQPSAWDRVGWTTMKRRG